MTFYVYILASKRNGALYIGSTDDRSKRTWERREGLRAGFTRKCGVPPLVWHQAFDTREAAFRRERRMKKWNRAWKIELIERSNPGRHDLYADWM